MCASLLPAASISTRLGEVHLDNVRYGQSFSMRDSLNMPLRVTNKSEKPVEMVMELKINNPGDHDLVKGYEPLPDPSWVKLEKTYFPRVEPNNDAETDIVITIPKDKKYLGKQYQFYVWAKTVSGLSNINIGVMSKFLITIISANTLAILEGRKKPDIIKSNLDFNLLPYEIFVKQIKVGKKYDLDEVSGGPIKVVNPNSDKMQFKIYPMTSNEAQTFVKEGYDDLPDARFITFKDKEVSVPPESIKRVKAYLQIPDKPLYKGKKYQAILVLEGEGQDVSGKVYARVYITTEE